MGRSSTVNSNNSANNYEREGEKKERDEVTEKKILRDFIRCYFFPAISCNQIQFNPIESNGIEVNVRTGTEYANFSLADVILSNHIAKYQSSSKIKQTLDAIVK